MADNDYLCIYRQFFENFAETFRDEYRPLRCNVYSLSLDELLGEVMLSSVNFLTARNCPRGLVVPLTKIIVEEFLNEAKKQPEEVNTPLKLNNKTLDKISEVCLRYRDNEKLSSLPGPVQETLFSTHSTKHTRRQMEDRLICLPRFNAIHNVRSNSEAGFYGIFDGHGGINAACYVVSHLHQFLAESEYYPKDPVKAFRHAYEKTESRYNSKEENSGTTALVILHQPVEKRLIVSWVGDSLAMLVTEDSYVMLVDPHKPERSDERKRIEDLGGFIVKAQDIYRVNGGLAVSRAIGDKKLKPHVSAEPEIRVLNLTGSEQFIVMGCDGLWDVVEPQQVIETVYFEVKKSEGRIDTVARRLVDLAKENNSTDNISVIVIFLTDPVEICKKSVDASGHWPKILLQDGVIMEANFQKNEISSLNDPGMNGIYGANGNHFGDHMKNESDEDFGPETDVDAIDDILTSPKNLNHFASEGWQKTQVDETADRLIEFARADNADVGDDNVKFSDDFAGSLKSGEDAAHTEQELCKEMRSDMFSVDNSNPFGSPNKNNMSDLLDFPNNGRDNNKYVEEVNFQKEDMDNFMNSNLMEQPFEMKSETNFGMEDSHELNINKNPFGFEDDCRMDSKDILPATDRIEADDFFNSDHRREVERDDQIMKPANDGESDEMHEKSVPESNNEDFEGISLNAANAFANSEEHPVITNTTPRDEMGEELFKMNEPEPDLFRESLAADNAENPPVLGSMNEPLEIERISRDYYPADEEDVRREEEPSSELISPSAPTLEGEARDDIIAESGGEVEDSDDEWNYIKVESGKRVPAENISFDSVPPSNESSELDKSKMNSPLNPDAAEFIPVTTKPLNEEFDANTTPVKALPRDLSDIVASSPNWANMENVNLPEESTFLCEIKSRPSNIFDEVETTPKKTEDMSNDLKREEVLESPVDVSVTSPGETEKEEEKIGAVDEEPRGIALASDMTSSFIDPSTMSNQDESPEEKVVNVVEPIEEPVTAREIIFNEEVPERQEYNGEFEVQMAPKLPDLLSPTSVEDGISSPVSPIPETPKSTEVEAPMSPRPEIINFEAAQPLMSEVELSQPISPSPATQVATSPDSKEPVEGVPAVTEVAEKLVEKEENSNKTVSPEIIGATAAVVAATAAAAAPVIAAVKKAEDVKKDVKKAAPKTAPLRTSSKPATTKPVLNGTKTATPTKKPTASTPPAKTGTTAKTVSASTTSAAPTSRTVASRVSSLSKPAPKPMSSSVTSTLNKTQVRAKPASATSLTSKVSSPTKPTVPSSTTKSTTAPVKSTSRVSGVTATSAAPKPKPRVPSAPVDKKTSPIMNGDSKSTVKRTELTSKKPSTTSTTSSATRVSLSARPATAPAKTITKTTVTTTRTITAKPRSTLSSNATTTTSTSTTTNTVTAAGRVSLTSRKPVNDKQAKEVANRITSKTTVTKTNGTLQGKTTTTTTTTSVTKTRKSLSTATIPKTEKDNKTEIKAEKIVDQTVEIIQSENDNSLIVDNNKDINLINSIASN